MNKKRAAATLAGSVVLFLLAAFVHERTVAQEPPCVQHQRQFCNGNQCTLPIAVSSCSGISVAQDELHLCRANGAKRITWTLPPGGQFRFRSDGIDFKGLPNTDDFDPATKRPDPFRYSWDNRLRNGGSFEYAIRLVSTSGQFCDKDPRILND